MLKNKKKKAFTIVELVIVIAVIAILAAVLIPTFANLIDKANQSADIQAARQMNVALAAGSIPDAPENPQEMIKILADAGFNSEKSLIPITKIYQFYWVDYENYNIIVLAQVPEVLRVDSVQAAAGEPEAQAENDVEIKVIYPVEDKALVNLVKSGLEALAADAEVLYLFNLRDGQAYLDSLLGGNEDNPGDESDNEPDNGTSGGTGEDGENVVVTAVTLSETSLTLKKDETATLTATVLSGKETINKNVTWTSSDENVATVEDGVVTAGDPGTATITATVGEKSATCTVIVGIEQVQYLYSDEFGNGKLDGLKLKVGDVRTVYVDIQFGAGTGKWEIAGESGVVVGEESISELLKHECYVITAKKPGKATITFISGTYVASCDVTVEEKSISTAEELADALKKGGEIKLANSITLTWADIGAIDEETVLDLQGYSLTLDFTGYYLNIRNTVTIKNGTINLTDGAYINVSDEECTGVLNLEDVTVKQCGGMRTPIQNDSILNITNSKFYKTGTWRNELVSNSSSGTVNIYGTKNEFVADDTVKDISVTETNTATDAVILNSGSINIYGELEIKTDGEYAFNSIERDVNNNYIKGTINIKDGGSLTISGTTVDKYGDTQFVYE